MSDNDLDLGEILDLLAVAELSVAGYYAACATIGGAFGVLCTELREEEIHHASYLRILQRKVEERPGAFRPGRRFAERAIRSFTEHVRQGTRQVMHRDLTRMQMLAFGLDVERSLLENRPWEVLQTDDAELTRLLAQLRDETESHHRRLQEQIRRVRAA